MLGSNCAHCGSNHTQAATDYIQCLTCGGRTGADNQALPSEPGFEILPGRRERP